MPLNITTARRPQPPRILIHGPGGIGKTTMAAGIADVVMLPIEEGADAFDVPRLPAPSCWAEVMASIDALKTEQHPYAALAIDSISALEPLCMSAVCAAARVKSIEDIPYGKGYGQAAELWSLLLRSLGELRAQRGMAIILIGHSIVQRYDDPRTQGYDRLQPRLHKQLLPMTIEWCDAVLCAAYRVVTDSEKKGFNGERTRAIGDGVRIMYCQERPAYVAKNRYGLPHELPFEWPAIVNGIIASFVPTPVPSPAEAPAPATTAAPAAQGVLT